MKRRLRLVVVSILCPVLGFSPFINAWAADLALPSGDLIAPEVKSTPITKEFSAGEDVLIRVTATDNVAVKNVTLFYRDMGSADFKRKDMARETDTDVYSATLPAVVAPGLEYYIQASDQAGNIILHGHTFSPFTVAVSVVGTTAGTSDEAITRQDPLASESEEKGVSKWVWIGLGVLAVGVIASQSGDDDTSGGDQTGTVTIIGPTP